MLTEEQTQNLLDGLTNLLAAAVAAAAYNDQIAACRACNAEDARCQAECPPALCGHGPPPPPLTLPSCARAKQ